MSEKAPPYPLDPAYQMALANALCSRPRVFGVVGRELTPDRFALPAAALAVKLARAHAKEHGMGPSAVALVSQRAYALVASGKLHLDAYEALLDLFLASTDVRMTDKELVEPVAAIIRAEMSQQVVRTAMDDYAKRGTFDATTKMARAMERVGVVDRQTGLRFGRTALDAIRRRRFVEKLPVGLTDLDAGLGGGLGRGHAGLYIAVSKGGKSIYLNHAGATALRRGLFVAMATLELSEEDQQARLIANLTGFPTDTVMYGGADERIEEMLDEMAPTLGVYRAKFFPAKVTSMLDIEAWIEELEEEEGREVDLVLVDYIDKVASSNSRHESSYDVQEQAAEDFRLYVHNRQKYGWSAAQPQRLDAKARRRRLEMDDVSGSMGKIRVFDLVVTGHKPTDDVLELYVAGNRHGPDKWAVPAFPHDFATGRLTSVDGQGTGEAP